jgi:peptidoglycan/LPS O-acetylase OafA/YrhL
MGAWEFTVHGSLINPIHPLWSISVEEQFYLLAPWVVKHFNRRSLFGFCALLILVANTRLYTLGRASVPSQLIWFDSLVQFECFAAGILLCLFLHGRMPSIVFWQRSILLAGAWFCWFFACYRLNACFDNQSGNPGSWPMIGGYALAVLGTVLLLIAFLGMDSNLLPKWAIYLGRISYGLYVYHGFALFLARHLLAYIKGPAFFLKSALALGLTVLFAALSYRYIETPFLKMKKRHAVIESQPIAGES